MVYNEQVLLIALTSLERPVERASHDEDTIDNHKLVVHVVLSCAISSNSDASVGEGLAIIAPVGHAFVISNDTNVHSLAVDVLHSVCQNIIGEVEDTDKECLLCHLDVPLQLINVVEVGEEEGIHVAWLRSH